jgi:hypothetical protein
MRNIIITMLLFASIAAAAQNPNREEREERLQAYRIAKFTEVLRLTPDEAQGFWPIYNEYLDNKEKAQDQYKPFKQMDAQTDAEVEEQIKRHFEFKQRELDLEKDLYQRLRKVLPIRKIAKIPNAEREFREQILLRLKEARQQRQGGGQGRN